MTAGAIIKFYPHRHTNPEDVNYNVCKNSGKQSVFYNFHSPKHKSCIEFRPRKPRITILELAPIWPTRRHNATYASGSYTEKGRPPYPFRQCVPMRSILSYLFISTQVLEEHTCLKDSLPKFCVSLL